MKRPQNSHALQRVKTAVEACAAQTAAALEAVITTPTGDARSLAPLQAALQEFLRVPGTLRMLGLPQLALLSCEVQLVLEDTLRCDLELERAEQDPRLESAFVAVTDLPALLECALLQSGDNFELIFKLVNRLRKARGCAVVFTDAALTRNAEVDFRKQFATQPQKMLGLLAKQVEGLQRAAAALAHSPGEARALHIVTTVFDNLEFMLRDHRSGVLWGLARALVEVYANEHANRPALAACFLGLVPFAQRMVADVDQLQAGVDEALLERLVSLVAGAAVDDGRPRIVKLWYNLNLGAARQFRNDYRDIQVRYYNKGALIKCLTLLGEDSKRMLEGINAAADASAARRERAREIYQGMGKLRDVLRVLRLDALGALIDAGLPATPGEELDAAFTVAANLLFRISGEVAAKLEKLERAAFGDATRLGTMEGANASRARVLQNALQTLEAVTVALDEHMAEANVAHLQQVHAKLDALTSILGTVQLDDQARPLAVARDYVAWVLTQVPGASEVRAERHWLLARLLVNSLHNLGQLLDGRAAAAPQDPDPAVTLRAFLDAESAQAAPAAAGKLVLISGETRVRASQSVAVNDAAPVPTFAAQPVVQNNAGDESLLAVFLEEADELLQVLNSLFLNWRQAPQDKACVDEYLRVLHTIKGSAALVGEHALSRLAHDYETFVVATGRSDFDAAFFTACDVRLHALHDVYRQYSRDAAGHIVKSAPVRATPVVVSVDAVAPPEEVAAATPGAEADDAQTATAIVTPAAPYVMPQATPVMAPPAAPAPDEQMRVSARLLKALLNDADEIDVARSRVETGFHEIGALLLDMDTTLNRFKACAKALDHLAGKPPARFAQDASRNAGAERNAGFDALEMDRYTELQELAVSLAENHNDLQDIRANIGARVKDIGQSLDGQQRLTNSLHDGLILTQLVPFASVVPRLARLVRQIGTQLDKPVRLDVENQQGSLDRNILQAIVTPLEHILRNAIDHGIETSSERERLGKPAEAALRITVARRGASFRIEIRDDGQGVDVDRVRQRAIAKGLLQPEAKLTEQETYALLFRSGFSTAASVSSISGRGVGLDVVKNEIAQIGGSVEIESVWGTGAAVILNLPLTSSLNRALVFTVQETRYAVLMNTLDGVLVEKLASVHQKQQQEGRPVFDYGGKQYEYLYLGKLINEGLKPRLDSVDSAITLLLVSGPTSNHALHIDAIVESRDFVVKSLGQQFTAMPGIGGGVILPDASVAIVLDLKALLGAQGTGRQLPEALLLPAPKSRAERLRKLVMVVDDSVTVRKATSDMLKRNGMDVITARNGVEALELLEKQVPDMILLDIEMPRMDGFEVASWIRSQERPVCDIPVIMITSRIGAKHRSRADAIGVNEYLCKPFKEDSLLQSLSGTWG